jgi:quinol monooxygenase YgiN
MATFIVHHTVEDYAKWKPFFDQDSAARKAAGSKGGILYRSADNPNELFILWDWEDLASARKFAESPDLREIMQKAGVVGRPDIHFLELIETVKV